MTSNAGARDAAKGTIGFGRKEHDASKVMEAVEKAFAPEFRNRLDAVVEFDSLPEDVIRLIVNNGCASIKAGNSRTHQETTKPRNSFRRIDQWWSRKSESQRQCIDL